MTTTSNDNSLASLAVVGSVLPYVAAGGAAATAGFAWWGLREARKYMMSRAPVEQRAGVTPILDSAAGSACRILDIHPKVDAALARVLSAGRAEVQFRPAARTGQPIYATLPRVRTLCDLKEGLSLAEAIQFAHREAPSVREIMQRTREMTQHNYGRAPEVSFFTGSNSPAAGTSGGRLLIFNPPAMLKSSSELAHVTFLTDHAAAREAAARAADREADPGEHPAVELPGEDSEQDAEAEPSEIVFLSPRKAAKARLAQLEREPVFEVAVDNRLRIKTREDFNAEAFFVSRAAMTSIAASPNSTDLEKTGLDLAQVYQIVQGNAILGATGTSSLGQKRLMQEFGPFVHSWTPVSRVFSPEDFTGVIEDIGSGVTTLAGYRVRPGQRDAAGLSRRVMCISVCQNAELADGLGPTVQDALGVDDSSFKYCASVLEGFRGAAYVLGIEMTAAEFEALYPGLLSHPRMIERRALQEKIIAKLSNASTKTEKFALTTE